MNRQTLSIVILGLALTVGAGLFVGGCALLPNWYPMFALIPALLALVAVYGIHSTSGSGAQTGWISFDGWIFLLMFFLSAVLGLPLVLYHTMKTGDVGSLVLTIIGPVIIFIGFALNYIIPACRGDDESSD